MERERERDRYRAVEKLRGLGTNNGKLMDDLDTDRSSDRDMYDRLGGRVPDRKRLLENVVNMDRDRDTYEKVDAVEFDRDIKDEEISDDKSSLRFTGRVNVLERMRALDREREEERQRLRERGREDERNGCKERGSRDELLQELVSQYKTALGELTFNSKPIITNLTIIAGENVHAAKGIASTVCSHILEVPKEQKLPSLYLLDSIVKNIGGDYVRYFAVRLPEVFCKSYKHVDSSTHPAMQHLFRTWRGVFPASPLLRIELELEFVPQSNSPSMGTLQAKSVDSSSQRTGHGIHVNPKYVEAQRQRLQQIRRVEGAPVEEPEPRGSERSTVIESTKGWPETALIRSMVEHPQRADPFGKLSLGHDSTSERSDQNVVLDSPAGEVASRGGMDGEIFGDRKWTLEREELGKSERSSDALSSQRNGFDWKMTSARGTKSEELRNSRLGPLFAQPSEPIDLSRRSFGNWPNLEEEYVWDEVSSREREHDVGVERREDWSPADLDMRFRNAGLVREKRPKLKSEFSETLDWRRYSNSSHLEQPLGFDDRLSPFQELDKHLHQSTSHLINGLGGLREPISGVDALSMSHLKAGHHAHALCPPLLTLQHRGPPAQSRLHSLQLTVPSRSPSLLNVNPGYLPKHLDSATHSPTRLGSMLFRPSSSLEKFYQTNTSSSLGIGLPTIGNLSPVTPASNVAMQTLPQMKPILPSFSTHKFSFQHVPPLPPVPPSIPPTSQQQPDNSSNPSRSLAPVLPFQQPNLMRPFQIGQPFHQPQGALQLQEVAMSGKTLQGLEPPQLPVIQGSHNRQIPLSVSSVPEVQHIQVLPPQQHVEALAPLQDAPQQTLQPVQPPPHLQQPASVQAFQSQCTEPLNNVVSGIQLNGPALAPPSAPDDQPNKEALLAALLKSELMPPSQNTFLQSQPQPSSSMAIASFTPNISTSLLQAPPPLPTCPPFNFSAPVVNPMTVQALSPALVSSNSLPQLASATSLATFSLQSTRNSQPPLPPGPPPSFTPIVSGAIQPAALGESSSVNQLSSLLSSLVARGFITPPMSSTGASVSSVPLAPQTILPVLQSSDFSFVSTDVAQISSVSTSIASTVAIPSIPTSAVNASSDADIFQPADVIGTEFKHDILKQRHEFVITSLYSDFPRQCKTCGLRFLAQEEHSKHMDWHVARNRRQKSQKTISRKWLVGVKEWLGGTGVSTPVVAPFFGEEIETKVEEEETLAVPADENQIACALCQELFEDFFSDETEEWMYKGAVYLNVSPGSSAEGLDSTLRGPIVHAKCKSESATTLVGIDSSEDFKEELKDKFRSRKRVRY